VENSSGAAAKRAVATKTMDANVFMMPIVQREKNIQPPMNTDRRG
jgi:hypothetical protein